MGRPCDPELAAAQALVCAEQLAQGSSPVAMIGRSLGLPASGDGPQAWARFLHRWADIIYPPASDLAERAKCAAILLGGTDPSLDRADLQDIAEAIERAVADVRGQARAIQRPEEPLARVSNLRPATAPEVADLVALDEAVAHAQGKLTVAEMEAQSLVAGLRLVDRAQDREPGGAA